jgi:LPS sulfotransferase NodH
MKQSIVIIAASALLFAAPQALAKNTYSQQQCKTWFSKIDRNRDGSIGEAENAEAYLARITLASEQDSSGGTFTMSKTFFVAECSIGSLGKPGT